jgi:hypothetical protein
MGSQGDDMDASPNHGRSHPGEDASPDADFDPPDQDDGGN